MSESNPIQIQTQLNKQIQEIKVSKRVYNVVRSIVDSSTKPIYEWNKPIRVSDNVVKFVKYKLLSNGLEVKAWSIVVHPLTIQKEGAELEAISINVYDGFGNKVSELRIRETFLPSEQDLDGFKPYVLKIASHEIIAKSLHEFEYYEIVPITDVPFAEPIPLSSFVNKLMFYFNKALSVVRNGNAYEDDGI
jgi:hypothetical protein